MSFEPQKFFVGLVDFFSVLMPGALLAYLCKDWVGFQLFDEPEFLLKEVEDWMLFLFISYLLGHFLFLVGAELDDWLYEPIRSSTYWGQVRRLANGKGLSNHRLRRLATSHWLFGSNADAAVMQAQWLKVRALQGLSAEGTINAFQWCKARLSIDHPAGLAEIQRFEANSKFFRSFAVMLVFLAGFYLLKMLLISVAVCLVLVPLALWRYMDQRFKATQQAYWLIIMLEARNGSSGHTNRLHRTKDGLTHAGGVVFRIVGQAIEYLLIRASKDCNQWVLPKGHIEPGEFPKETAVREVREETGYWARVIQLMENVPLKNNCVLSFPILAQWIKHLHLGINPEVPVVQFFLMEAIEDEEFSKKEYAWPAEIRQYQWLILAVARQTASFNETKSLLVEAEILIKKSRSGWDQSCYSWGLVSLP